MGLLDWIYKKVSGDDEDLTGYEQEVHKGLNLKQELDSHLAWKVKLQEVIDGKNSETFDAATVARDDLCELGKWLYGEGKKNYGNLPEYQSLRLTHSVFHLCAGQVLSCCESGNTAKAKTLLQGEFINLMNNNQLELVRFFSVVK